MQFTAKSLQRQAKKANKDETTEKNKVKLVCRLISPLVGLQARVQGVLQGEKCKDKDRGHVDLQALQKGNTEGAQIYAQNAIRKKTEGLNLLRLASRIDAVASRVETAVTMRSVTNSMGSVVKGMDKAMESMNLERVSCFLLCWIGS